MSKEVLEALHALERERGIPHKMLLQSICDAMAIAYRKTPEASELFEVRFDEKKKAFCVFEQQIPEDLEDEILIHDKDTNNLLLDYDALEFYRDQVAEKDVTPKNFGRVAALTARQVIMQKLRDFDQGQAYELYQGREGEMVIGTIQQGDKRHTLVNIGNGIEALLPRSEQVEGEKYRHGTRVRAVIKEVEMKQKGCSIILSRRHPDLVRQLMIQEVPEVSNGLIDIVKVVRDPGVRTKIGVVSKQEGIDPVGACIGPRGSRIRNVITELSGEKVDIITLDVDPAHFLTKSLSPAKVRAVDVNDENKQATVIVPDGEVSKAIGHKGQNVRLTAQLTGWKIDILSESQFAQLQDFSEDQEESVETADGRCIAVVSSGRRCPNAALVGEDYCGLPRHQALQFFATNSVKILHDVDNDVIKSILEEEENRDALVKQVEAKNAFVYEEEKQLQEELQKERDETAEQLEAYQKDVE